MNEARTKRQPLSSDPWTLLGVSINTTDEEIRAAYVKKLRGISPETEPERFEALRNAFRLIKDPIWRTFMTIGIQKTLSVQGLVDSATKERGYAGPDAWLAAFFEAKR